MWILWARILEWVAVPSSRGSSPPRDWTCISCIAGRLFTTEPPGKPSESEVAQSCPTLCEPMGCSLPGSSVHGIFQAIVLEWIAISFSRGSSQPGDQTWVSCIAARFFTIWATGETLISRKRHCLADIVLASAICSMSGSHSASFPKLRERYHCNLLSAWSPAVSGVVPLPWAPELKWEWVRYLTKKK